MPGTLCLTFDDLFVANWVAARPVFADHDARVTFCVSHLHEATPEQLDGLHLLQSDGHEIACHSRTHPRLKPYLDAHGLDHWLEHEVDRALAEHRAAGFPARIFACPFHASTPETRTALATRFEIIRAAGPRSVDPANPARRIYSEIPASRCLDNLGFADMQHKAFPGWRRQHHLLDLIARTDGLAVFTGHDIRDRKTGPGFYSTTRQIGRLLQAATARGITVQPA
ncbi:MAG: polysaccharide deacetylase family protein [Roseovarius sp.]